MISLLIRLQQLRACCERAAHNHQFTQGEKNSARSFKTRLRDRLPAEVLRQYDRLKQTEPALLRNPEVFAMAVLVATYRSLSPAKRKKVFAHFAVPPPQRTRTSHARPQQRGG